MTNIKKDNILDIVTAFYLESSDFNGIHINALLEKSNQNWKTLKILLEILIEDGLVGIIDTNTDVNPYIIRTGFEKKDYQISKLVGDSPTNGCIYPTSKYLNSIVNPQNYKDQPYKLCLALGEAQLAYRSFDLSVLEFYRNEPRYRYENDDVNGRIYYDTEELKDSDKILLETFGFSYDGDYNRAVAVFLRYLSDLTPEHQLIWKTKEVKGNFKLHPDYYRNSVIGDWGEGIPICSAILIELNTVNKMAKAMGRAPLFKNYYGEYGEDRPKRFGFLIRPTLEEFNNFMLLFDKMLSDNINLDFFQNEVSYEEEIKRKDGKIQVQQKGTLKILDEWIRTFFKTDDWKPWEESISTLRKIRKFRQKPAHLVDEDKFDQKYFKEQREIIKDAYGALRILCLMLAIHPRVKSKKVEMPSLLQEGKIWAI